jgi:NADH dehydrogenase FAD-containing subunit
LDTFQTAQVASQQGAYLGKKFSKVAAAQARRDLAPLPSPSPGGDEATQYAELVRSVDDDKISDPFRYRHLGSLAYIGNSAVFDFGGKNFAGGLLAMCVAAFLSLMSYRWRIEYDDDRYLWRSVYWSEAVSYRTRINLLWDWYVRSDTPPRQD